VFFIHRNVALLRRLEQIAAQPWPFAERTACALILVKADIGRLYACLGIGASNRLDIKIKTLADDSLADLRNRVLATEVLKPAPSRPIFTAVRHRLEMTRRVLASRLAEERLPAPLSSRRLLPVPIQDQRWINRAWQYYPAAGRVEPLYGLSLADRDTHPGRRAFLGSFSGQLTM
jgi:hypothetical protein